MNQSKVVPEQLINVRQAVRSNFVIFYRRRSKHANFNSCPLIGHHTTINILDNEVWHETSLKLSWYPSPFLYSHMGEDFGPQQKLDQ